MYRSQYFEGGRVLSAAISAIDIALLDIKGKALGVPVYQLLGGKCRDFVPTFASLRAASVDEAVALGADQQSLDPHPADVQRAGSSQLGQGLHDGDYIEAHPAHSTATSVARACTMLWSLARPVGVTA